MRAYSASDEETLRARELLKDWRGEGFLTEEQCQRLNEDCDLRRTNIFLRLVLLLFTLIIVGAGVGLFFAVFLSSPGDRTAGFVLLIFSGACYAAAEIAVSRYRLYRYGIEEGLAVCSIGFLCSGMQLAFFGGLFTSPASHTMEFLVPASGVIGSLWIWYRFGLPYAPLAAMIFAAWIPGYWTSSAMAQHVIAAAFYLAGLAAVDAVRPRHRFSYLDSQLSFAEALLWLAIYLAINLQVFQSAAPFPKPFYWATWALIWCLPPAALARGLRTRDRFVIVAGGIAAIATLVTNKPYLGWPRHTWDPMLLGALLIGVALFIRRWLAQGPGGVRREFTAQRLSGRDKSWMSLGSSAIGLAAPNILPPGPKGDTARFGGGDSGGAGASSDF